jgi:hypothetical protein
MRGWVYPLECVAPPTAVGLDMYALFEAWDKALGNGTGSTSGASLAAFVLGLGFTARRRARRRP